MGPIPAAGHAAPTSRARRLPRPRLVAAALALGLLASCSGAGVDTPAGDRPSDNYVLATITVQDLGSPCGALACAPEFFDCETLAGILPGTVFRLRSDIATAGNIPSTSSTERIAITGTDTSARTTLGIELLADLSTATPVITFGGDVFSNVVDVDTECNTLNLQAQPVSRFVMILGSGSVTTTALPAVEQAQDPSNPGVPFPRFMAAESDGAGGFAPASIFEGTFSFRAQNRQPTPSGVFVAEVLVQGCFRVNLPRPERGVPVSPVPTAPGAGCP